MTSPNATLAYAVLDQIDARPDLWNQHEWCGTAMCFAGWAVELSGARANGNGMIGDLHVADLAARLLGFEDEIEINEAGREATYPDGLPDGDHDEYELFSACNKREDLGRLVAAIFGPRPLDYGTGCRCDWLGVGTPEHAPSPLCRSLRPDADRADDRHPAGASKEDGPALTVGGAS